MMPDPVFDRLTRTIEEWYRAAIESVEPMAAVQAHLACDGKNLRVDEHIIPMLGRFLVLGVGKAAVGMARGVEAVCGDIIHDGLVITKDGHLSDPPLAYLRAVEAAHPVPDERGERATTRMLDLLQDLTHGDVVLALISGGGSALLEAPRPPVTLAEMGATTDLLLRAGAPIQDLNMVRIPLSLVKGGGLRRAAGGARLSTLILSDVLGNDPSVIASGPTVPGSVSRADALAVLHRFEVAEAVPSSVIAVLSSQSGDTEATHNVADDVVTIVGDNATMVEATAAAVEADGYRPRYLWHERVGEAADLGRAWVAACQDAPSDIDVLLGGGEATVTVQGDGVGGRNTEFALAAALALEEAQVNDWIVASLASDGEDGPTEAAGAVAEVGTAQRARAAGVDPLKALRENDSLRVFEAAGGLIAPGPTGTNVNDLYIAVRRQTSGG